MLISMLATKSLRTEKADMNLVKLEERFSDPEKARDYLEQVRWPGGIKCPRCKDKHTTGIKGRHTYNCNACHYQFSVTSGTIFHDSHLPLWKWFGALYLLTGSEKPISACSIQERLSVSYRTAWYLGHRIRAALQSTNVEREQRSRRNRFLLRNTLVKVIRADSLPYAELTKAA